MVANLRGREQSKPEMGSPPKTDGTFYRSRENQRNVKESRGRRPAIALACSSERSEPSRLSAGTGRIRWKGNRGRGRDIGKATSLQFGAYLPFQRVLPVGLEETRRDKGRPAHPCRTRSDLCDWLASHLPERL